MDTAQGVLTPISHGYACDGSQRNPRAAGVLNGEQADSKAPTIAIKITYFHRLRVRMDTARGHIYPISHRYPCGDYPRKSHAAGVLNGARADTKALCTV